MNRRIIKPGWTLILVILIGILSYSTVFAGDFGDTRQQQTEVPVPVLYEDPANQVTLGELRLTQDSFLLGPVGSLGFTFNLPASWQLTSGAVFQLDITTYFSSLVIAQDEIDVEDVIAGHIEVTFNGIALQPAVLSGNGFSSISFEIPDHALMPNPYVGKHKLLVGWDASESCDANLATSVAIHPSSTLYLPHENAAIPTDLSRFPAPLYLEENPFSAAAALVVADEPTKGDLGAVIAISTGLGRLTQGKLSLDLVAASQLSEQTYAGSHLILVGQPEDFTILDDLSVERHAGGTIQIFVSPWNQERALILVSGDSDEGILNAGEALSSGALLTNEGKNLAIVDGVKEELTPRDFDQDQTLAELGHAQLSVTDFGTNIRAIPFTIPPETSIGADAYFDLVYNHSQMMDYLRSGIVLRINGVAIGSIRFSDATANLSTLRLIVPASALRPGANQLELQMDIIPRSVCSDPRPQNLWINIFPDSLLHLPLATIPVASQLVENISDYPLPFSNSALNDTTIVLAADDPAGWRVASQVVFNLGATHFGGLRNPVVLLAHEVSQEALEMENVIAVGLLEHLPVLESLGDILPAAFDAQGHLAAEVLSRITFQLDPGGDYGYLELAHSSLQPGKVLLAVLGNTGDGLEAAGNALTNPDLHTQMSSGNFAIIQGVNVFSEYLQPGAAGMVSTPSGDATTYPPGTTPMPEETAELPAITSHDPWVVPVLVISVILILMLFSYETYRMLLKRKA
ncbi:MAG: cellulose biosynthesis cyclic di-GMP-binding regulatory protein BcsB [Anaerolineaceae bacterium]|nr:cellulose biosynthesis cyclic di-GMP-binding regulatory protein BcsB [Anaerolineaceae bacterium]